MTPSAILAAVCDVYEIPLADLCGQSRAQWLVEARTVAVVLLREIGVSQPHCGALLKRDHSTIANLEMKAIRSRRAPHYAARLASVRDWLQVAA